MRTPLAAIVSAAVAIVSLAAQTPAPAVTLQFLWDSQTGAKQETRARVVWDAQAFYVGFDADDVDINARFEQRDDPTYMDDAVEIFINPDPKQEALYYGFEMNARGVLYDYLNYNSRLNRGRTCRRGSGNSRS